VRREFILTACLGLASVNAYPQQAVEIDIEPWSPANEVRPDLDRAIVISINSTNGGPPGNFDAAQVDPATIRFGPGEASNFALSAVHDVDGDTDSDIVLAFRTSESGIGCQDTAVSIDGETYGGELFTGSDTIETIDCPQACHPSNPPDRIATPLVVGDSMSNDPADWWNLSDEFDPVDFDIFAFVGEQVGRHSNNATRGMVRNISSYLDTAVSADSLIILGGTNDIGHSAHAGELKFAITDMVDTAKRRPSVRDIIVLSPTPFGNWSGFFSWSPMKQIELDEYLSWLPQFAADEGVHYVNVYSLLGDPGDPKAILAEYDAGDGLHINVLGALAIAEAVDSLILASRVGPEKGALLTVPQAMGWDTTNRTYDGVTVAGNELTWNRTVSDPQSLPGDTLLPASGKWYVELKIVSVDTISNAKIGLLREATHDPSWSGGLGSDGPQPSVSLADGTGISNGIYYGSNSLDIEAGTVVGIAYDADNDLAWVNVNGHWQELSSTNALPEAGTGGIPVDDAADFLVAVETTSTDIVVEFPAEIPASHVPAGFSTIY